jgi:DNA-binding response OmpR family regulator
MPASTALRLSPRVVVSSCDPRLEREVVAAFQSQSCEVLLAAEHRQALGRVVAGEVDVLVVDLGIYSGELSEFASEFKHSDLRCRTLVLAHSLEQAILAMEAQADGVLMPPVDPHQLRKVIHNLLTGTGQSACAWRGRIRAASDFTGRISLGHSRIHE